jgi:hypothetical protein
MPRQTLETPTTIQEIMEMVGKLPKDQIEFLSTTLANLLLCWEEESKQLLEKTENNHIVQLESGQRASNGKKRGGYVEWKMIPGANGKSYGPYPYWRYRDNGVYKSVYLKGLVADSR